MSNNESSSESSDPSLLEQLLTIENSLETVTFVHPRPQHARQETISQNSRNSIPQIAGQQIPENMTSNVITYSLNGKTYTVKETATPKVAKEAHYPKTERKDYKKKERMELLDKIQAKQQRDLFKSLTVSVNDPQKMTTTRSLVELLTENKRNLQKYDLLDVYTIVFPKEGCFQTGNNNYRQLVEEDGTVKTNDLFVNYLKLTTADVAASNKWFNAFAPDDAQANTDLDWSLAYYEKNVDADLYSKVHTKMSKHPIDEQGGPLFLKIMLDLVTTSAEANLRAIEVVLDTYKIKTSCPGEDIETVVGLFTAIFDTLGSLRDGELPADSVKKLLGIFQTTSVDDFNSQFETLEKAYVQAGIRYQLDSEFGIRSSSSDLKNNMKSAKYTLAYAEKAYRDLLQSGHWDKALQQTPGESAFFSQGNTDGRQPEQPLDFRRNRNTVGPCHNCGSTTHQLNQCPHPIDEARVAASKAKFNAKKNRERQRPTKWRLPEPAENNRRVINGKPYTFDPNTGRSGRWIEDQTPSDGTGTNANLPAQVHFGGLADLRAQIDTLMSSAASGTASTAGSTVPPPSDSSTIATTTADPVERKLQLHLLRAKIESELERL